VPEVNGSYAMNPAVARKKGGEAAKDEGELREICIKPAENGYTVTLEHKPPERKGKKGESVPYEYRPPAQHVFNDADAACGFVLGHMKRHARGKK
jgi:hypothetical protein